MSTEINIEDLTEDQIGKIVMANISFDHAIEIIEMSDFDKWEAFGEIPTHKLVNSIQDNVQYAKDLAIGNPEEATKVLEELLYWRKQGRI